MSVADKATPRVVTAQTAALEHLRHAISSGALKPGDQVRQESLAAELSLSIVPVREALKVLQTEGQLTYRPNKGFVVSKLSREELEEAYRIRGLLEDEAVRVGVPLLTTEDLELLAQLIEEMDRAIATSDVRALSQANRQFHFVFFEAAAMPRLANFIRILWDTTEPYRAMYFNESDHRRKVNEEHQAILSSARRGDPVETVQLLSAHRTDTVVDLGQLLENAP